MLGVSGLKLLLCIKVLISHIFTSSKTKTIRPVQANTIKLHGKTCYFVIIILIILIDLPFLFWLNK